MLQKKTLTTTSRSALADLMPYYKETEENQVVATTNKTEIVGRFRGIPITVIGDAILDWFAVGENGRISSEAQGVHIVNVESDSFIPGGAGNVARNVASLGGKPALVTVIGADGYGRMLSELLKNEKVVLESVQDDTRPTPRKMRVVSENGQEICVHWENLKPVDPTITRKLLLSIWQCNSEVIIISDYGRGVITEELLCAVIKYCNQTGKKAIIDPRPRAGWDCRNYRGAFLLTPSRKEAGAMTGEIIASLEDAFQVAKKLSRDYHSNVLLTIDGDGMILAELNGDVSHFPALETEKIECVSGCGDSVLTTVALAIAANASLKEACELAAHTAAIVVQKPGTAIADFGELMSHLTSTMPEPAMV